MEKENTENTPTIPEQQDLEEKECQPSSPKHVCNFQLVDLYISE